MIPFATERLLVRNWKDCDLDLFHEINSDPRVMRFFPVRRDRDEARSMMNGLSDGIAKNGFGFAPIEIIDTGEVVGFVGINRTDAVPSLPPGQTEIGWRLAPRFWGKGYATEAARAWLDRALDLPDIMRIVSFAVWNNEASIAVMRRIGMRHVRERDFDHPSVPDSHPHLKRHVYYEIEQCRQNCP